MPINIRHNQMGKNTFVLIFKIIFFYFDHLPFLARILAFQPPGLGSYSVRVTASYLYEGLLGNLRWNTHFWHWCSKQNFSLLCSANPEIIGVKVSARQTDIVMNSLTPGCVDFFFQLNLFPSYSLCCQRDNNFFFSNFSLASKSVQPFVASLFCCLNSFTYR